MRSANIQTDHRFGTSLAATVDGELARACDAAVETVGIELIAMSLLARAIEGPALGGAVRDAVEQMRQVKGRIVVTGVGKSGIAARKIAATLSSTGTPAHFMHGGDASHGDLGSVTDADLVVLLSWSGESDELANIVTYCRRFAIPLIVITGNADSTAGLAADVCLALPNVREACAGNMLPTSSTLIQLAIGDALAMAMLALSTNDLGVSDLRRFHPGGSLGARLRSVRDFMAKGDGIPVVALGATIRDAMVEMTGKRFGCTAVVGTDGSLAGVFTDGDLRRCLSEVTLTDEVALHMSSHPVTVAPGELASDAVAIMNERRISTLFACENGKPVGIVHLHDLLRADVIA